MVTRPIACLLGALALAALALPGAAAAQPQPRDIIPQPFGLISKNAHRLGLEGEQLAAVQAVVDAARARHEALVEKLEAEQQRMHDLLSQPTPDAADVMAEAGAMGGLETEIHKNHLKAIMDIRALLTPAQRAELLRIREEGGWWRRHRICAQDLDAQCPDATGRAALACLEKSWDQLSPPCRGEFEPGAGPGGRPGPPGSPGSPGPPR